MSSILQDLRYAARRLVKDRRFTLAAVAALALGIGATSAVFTLVNAVILRSLPFAEPDRIMWLGTRDAKGGEFGVSEPDFEDWRRATRTFSGISLMQMGPINFSADHRAPDQYDGALYFLERLLAHRHAARHRTRILRRGRSPGRSGGGAAELHRVAEPLRWRPVGRRPRDPRMRNRRRLSASCRRGCSFHSPLEVWLPASQRPTAQTRAGREGRLLMAYGRLADGMTIEQARTEMTGITGQLATSFPIATRTSPPSSRRSPSR